MTVRSRPTRKRKSLSIYELNNKLLGIAMRIMKSTAFVLYLSLLLTSCDGKKMVMVTAPPAMRPDGAFTIGLYAPYTASALLRDAERTYGPPKDSNVESTFKSGEHVSWKEYPGRLARIRIYESASREEGGGFSAADWLEAYPSSLYLQDLLSPALLRQISPREGAWQIYIRPANRAWRITIDMDGRRVVAVHDHRTY